MNNKQARECLGREQRWKSWHARNASTLKFATAIAQPFFLSFLCLFICLPYHTATPSTPTFTAKTLFATPCRIRFSPGQATRIRLRACFHSSTAAAAATVQRHVQADVCGYRGREESSYHTLWPFWYTRTHAHSLPLLHSLSFFSFQCHPVFHFACVYACVSAP